MAAVAKNTTYMNTYQSVRVFNGVRNLDAKQAADARARVMRALEKIDQKRLSNSNR